MTSLPVRISGSQRRFQRATSACYVNSKERDSLLDKLHATSPDGLERVVRGAARRVDDEISTLWAGTATRVRALASCTAASLTIRARSAVVCAGFVDGLLVLGRRAPGSSSKPHFEALAAARSSVAHEQPVPSEADLTRAHDPNLSAPSQRRSSGTTG